MKFLNQCPIKDQSYRGKNMAKYRIVKQLFPKQNHVSSSNDPSWSTRDSAYVAKISGSSDQLWEFDNEISASVKMAELSKNDDSGRNYKLIEI